MPRGVYRAMALGMLGSMGVWGCNNVPEAEEQEAVLGVEQAAITNLSSEALSADLTGDAVRVFPEGTLPLSGDVDFIDNQDPNLLVQQNNTEVQVTFISRNGVYNNALAFFAYQDGAPPTSAPGLTVVFNNTNIAQGTRVSLGYFNANTRIGFAVVQSGGGTTADLSKPKFYSVAGLNGGSQYFVSKYHKAERRRVIGSEDNVLSSSDRDFNDVLFSVKLGPTLEQPRRMTVCSYSFSDLTTGWRTRVWQPSDCSAGLPSQGSFPIGNPQNGNGDPRQQADCQISQGSHYYLGSGMTYNNLPFNPGGTTGTVTCAYLLPDEVTDIRPCSFNWSTTATGWRARTWQSSDCPRGLPESGSSAIAMSANGNGTSGDTSLNLSSGSHYNHPYMDGATSGEIKGLYVRPTQNNDNITICRYTFSNAATGWRTRTWLASDCTRGLPKAGAWSVGQAQNGNGTRGMVSCSPSDGSHYNHPDVSGATSGTVTCLYVNP